MKKILFLLLLLCSQPVFAELYKCSTTAGTAYQDKPCQSSQTQQIIPQAADTAPPSSIPQTTPESVQPQPAPIANGTPIAVERDAHGKIKRSEKAKDDFKAANPCPANGKRSGSCPGYVIDHIKALACGGADSPENMQWQTVAEGKEKDSWERDGCKTSAQSTAYPPSSSPVQQESRHEEYNSEKVYVGKRGGRYVMTKSGKKRYLPHQY